MIRRRWRKSSYSNPNGDCVELTSTLDQLRDSKDPDGPTLKVDVVAFIGAVQAGRFDR
ncbi:hypothetical protein BJ970_007333 [Saccharopolyspora phatthalungensis]|uniref:DUF397 domain-containing protein n=1 Tax=Saccharopolyspora phatthalungensis TaxID=664693 RepID=A0A840QFW4_9PSEU|nr:DUF397 domain-containing protein [Saccharopolyspora phatthalungensis]MBB5159734.1 hypothetical protein [Saccharopolyspora phatthalungensis]